MSFTRSQGWVVLVAIGCAAGCGSSHEKLEQSIGEARDLPERPDDGGDDEEADGGPDEANQEFLAQRAFPLDAIPPNAFTTGTDQFFALEGKAHVGGIAWNELGPSSLDTTAGQLPNAGPLSGRSTAIAVDPSEPKRVYLGTAQGGIWRSENEGASWTPIGDNLRSLAIGAIGIDADATNTLYVGTGEGNFSGDSYFGQGMLKSTDKGATFTTLARDTFAGLSFTKIVAKHDVVYAAAVRGVGATSHADQAGLYKSSDGGASWTRIVSGDVVDFEINPSVAGEILVSLYRKGVSVFQESTSVLTSVTLPGAIATSDRIELARAKTDPNVMYLGTAGAKVLRSKDAGRTWAAIPGAPDYCGSQCFYDNVVEVNPSDDNTIVLGGSLCAVQRVKAADTATPTVEAISMPDRGPNCERRWTQDYVHPDVHAVAFNPANPKKFYVASDGGIAFTDDSGDHWYRRNSGLGTLQFYKLCAEVTDSRSLAGGLQDNGSASLSAIPWSTVWNQFYGGDGAGCALNLKDPVRANRYALVSAQQGWIVRVLEDGSSDQSFYAAERGEQASFVTQVVQHPTKPQVVYTATTRLYESTNGGEKTSWRAISPVLRAGRTLDSFAVSADSKHFVAAAGAQIYATADGGVTWNNIQQAPLPLRIVTSLAIHPTNPDVMYAAFSGFGSATPTTSGHVFRTIDGGATWAQFDATLGLDLPVNKILLHPRNSNIVYVATDLGVVATVDGGATWGVLGNGQSHVAAFDLLFHEKDSKLLLGTHGRGAWALKFEPKIQVPEAPVALPDTGTSTLTGVLPILNGENAGSVLDYGISVVGAPWLSISPLNGVASGLRKNNHTITADISALAAGTYDVDVVVRDLRALVPEVHTKIHVVKH